MKTSLPSQYFTAEDIAELLKISYDSALKFVKYSGVHYIKIGRQYRVPQDALEVFLNKNSSIEIELEAENNKK